MKLETILYEKKLVRPTLHRSLTMDTKFIVNWHDGAECFFVVGNKSGHVYGCWSDEAKAERIAASLERKRLPV